MPNSTLAIVALLVEDPDGFAPEAGPSVTWPFFDVKSNCGRTQRSFRDPLACKLMSLFPVLEICCVVALNYKRFSDNGEFSIVYPSK